MTASALNKVTIDTLDNLSAFLDQGHSDQVTALLKTGTPPDRARAGQDERTILPWEHPSLLK